MVSKGSIADIRKKFHETHELVSTAYHESGHTIYGLLHFMEIDSVLVYEEKRSKRICGFTHYNSPAILELSDPDLINDRIHAEIGLSYAGLAAEKHYFKMISGSDKFPSFLKEGSSSDIMGAAYLFQKFNIADPGKARMAYKKQIIKSVETELKDNWDAVTLVAHALFKRKKLYFSDLNSLLSKKSENKKFWVNQLNKIKYFYDNCSEVDENQLKIMLSL